MILRLLAVCALLNATEIKRVPPLAEPISPAGPVFSQLRVDLAAL